GVLEDRAVSSVAAVLHADRAVPAVLLVLLGHRPRVRNLGTLPMKALAVAGHVREHRGRPEALAVPRRELLEDLDREARAQVVEVPERTAQERREAEAEDRTPVPVPRRAQAPLLQA